MKHMYLDVSKDILNIERPKLFENVSVARVTYVRPLVPYH